MSNGLSAVCFRGLCPTYLSECVGAYYYSTSCRPVKNIVPTFIKIDSAVSNVLSISPFDTFKRLSSPSRAVEFRVYLTLQYFTNNWFMKYICIPNFSEIAKHVQDAFYCRYLGFAPYTLRDSVRACYAYYATNWVNEEHVYQVSSKSLQPFGVMLEQTYINI
ncbi:hypothetical protein AVEN_144454-1 [Araneus ventricosus]|uniref:Uncharacterized protein n=1 Tax=Araneus ventricosus TaxID=182803 RepID=A0A4Y2E4B5_ARAVE|nr:hypothetical protein AVEN_144454-1 [Araneus ventricosus]